MRCARARSYRSASYLPLCALAGDDRHIHCLCWNLGRRRRRRNGRRATGRDRGGFRRLAATVRTLEGPACLPPAALWTPRPTPPAPCTHARAHIHAYTHAHTRAHTRTHIHARAAVCVLQAMRPSQSTERETESPHRISTPAAPFWRRGGRGHNVEITWHDMRSHRRDISACLQGLVTGAGGSLARPPSSPKARTTPGFAHTVRRRLR